MTWLPPITQKLIKRNHLDTKIWPCIRNWELNFWDLSWFFWIQERPVTSVLLLHIRKKAHCCKSVRMSESSVSTITKRINHLENWKTKDQMKQNKNWVIIMTIGIKHQVRLRKKIFMSLDQCKQHFWQQTANHSLPQKRTTLH